MTEAQTWRHQRERKRRVCSKKTRYPSMRAAHNAAENLRDKGDNVHAYKCPYPNGGKRHFHVGHSAYAERYIEQGDDHAEQWKP